MEVRIGLGCQDASHLSGARLAVMRTGTVKTPASRCARHTRGYNEQYIQIKRKEVKEKRKFNSALIPPVMLLCTPVSPFMSWSLQTQTPEHQEIKCRSRLEVKWALRHPVIFINERRELSSKTHRRPSSDFEEKQVACVVRGEKHQSSAELTAVALVVYLVCF